MNLYSNLTRKHLLFTLIVFLFSIQLFAQNTYYVSTSGNDSNDGSSSSPWLTIQGAINNSVVVNGDTIIVKDGTYTENVEVSKEIVLKSENGYSATTVVAASTSASVIKVSANNVTVDGFTAYGASESGNHFIAAVYLNSVTGATISNNRCGYDATHYNEKSIMLTSSDNNTISNNICKYANDIGIQLWNGSDNNTISNNTIDNNNYGIQMDASSGNTNVGDTFRGNEITDNTGYGVYIVEHTTSTDFGANNTNDKGRNTISNNDVGHNEIQFYNGTSNTINCYYNYWGYTDSTTIDSHIYDNEEGTAEVYFSPFLTSDQALPVELTSFTANVNSAKVSLHWQTATEVNNYGFEVQRSAQSEQLSEFKTIGFVQGHGNSNSPKDYSFTDENPPAGKVKYRLKQIDTDGGFEYSNIAEIEIGAPEKFELLQNYPNPFNPTTKINYVIARSAATRQSHELSVRLTVYDILGRQVATLVNKKQAPGNYSVQVDASRLSSGIYFYKLSAGKFTAVKKMILMK